MNPDTLDYLKKEFEYLQKAAEIQFSHFMHVFYFWTTIVMAPITAKLLITQDAFTSDKSALPALLILIAIIGWFLSAKMFDIRCSQLTYISKINYIRATIYNGVRSDLPTEYTPPFFPEKNLRCEAFKDFGILMALTMSIIDGICLGFGIPLLQGQTTFNCCIFISYSLFGLITYIGIVLWRGPKPIK